MGIAILQESDLPALPDGWTWCPYPAGWYAQLGKGDMVDAVVGILDGGLRVEITGVTDEWTQRQTIPLAVLFAVLAANGIMGQ